MNDDGGDGRPSAPRRAAAASSSGSGRRGARSVAIDGVDPRARAVVRGLGALGARDVRRRDDLQRLAQVVEDQQRVGEDHAQRRQVESPGRARAGRSSNARTQS